ncbi:MAG: hypothetical protein GAK43_01655 [Stenotrophomonas maltophilia]|nr:MAG: hypothetical protein GAK43_01655 [Stenotrophomonas maltophilia]
MNRNRVLSFVLLAGLPWLAAQAAATGAGVVRHGLEGTDFPISMAVEVAPSATLVELSGVTASDLHARQGIVSLTEAQTVSAFDSLRANLKRLGLGLKDVVRLRVYLVADGTQPMDLAGFQRGYVRFFGTAEQPALPSRTVVQVVGLTQPGALVEIEATAVRH